MEKVCEFLKAAGVYPDRKSKTGIQLARCQSQGRDTQVLYFKNATATFSSFTAAPEVITF